MASLGHGVQQPLQQECLHFQGSPRVGRSSAQRIPLMTAIKSGTQILLSDDCPKDHLSAAQAQVRGRADNDLAFGAPMGLHGIP
jgi:hypothetical protein